MRVRACLVGLKFDLMFIVGQKFQINAFLIMLIDAFQNGSSTLKCNGIVLKRLFESLYMYFCSRAGFHQHIETSNVNTGKS